MLYLERLKALKEKRGLTSAEIAELANIPQATVKRIFNGTTPDPRFDTIASITIALGGSLDEIAGLKQSEEQPSTRVEHIMANYTELLKEKDERIKEKDQMITMLKELGQQDRTQKMRLLWFIGGFVTIVVLLLLFDILNGHFGYFQY